MIKIHIKRDTRETMSFDGLGVCCLHFISVRAEPRTLILNDEGTLHSDYYKLYEEYCLNQAKQKGGKLPAFHKSRFQQGYGLGSKFKSLFRWAVPHLQQGAKGLGKN